MGSTHHKLMALSLHRDLRSRSSGAYGLLTPITYRLSRLLAVDMASRELSADWPPTMRMMCLRLPSGEHLRGGADHVQHLHGSWHSGCRSHDLPAVSVFGKKGSPGATLASNRYSGRILGILLA